MKQIHTIVTEEDTVMWLKKNTDFTLRVLMFLGVKGSVISTIKEIAQHFEISQNHLMKIVHHLGQLGYVHTQRGKNGGIYLGLSARDIQIGDILRETGENNELAECFVQAVNCRITPQCKLRHIFQEASQAFFKVLDH